MSPSAREYLQHRADECVYLIAQGQNSTQTQFLHDETLKRAFARSVESIAEAVKHIPHDIRVQYPQIEWRTNFQFSLNSTLEGRVSVPALLVQPITAQRNQVSAD